MEFKIGDRVFSYFPVGVRSMTNQYGTVVYVGSNTLEVHWENMVNDYPTHDIKYKYNHIWTVYIEEVVAESEVEYYSQFKIGSIVKIRNWMDVREEFGTSFYGRIRTCEPLTVSRYGLCGSVIKITEIYEGFCIQNIDGRRLDFRWLELLKSV